MRSETSSRPCERGLLRGPGDALLVVDVQRDFLPGGALAVTDGDAVIPALNRYAAQAEEAGARVFASRDWHPPNHCSFREHGGRWPPHCVAGTAGAQLAADLRLPPGTRVVDKGTRAEAEAYSAFSGTGLADILRAQGVKRLVVAGLATDYCVLSTVRDALAEGFDVVVPEDAIRAVDACPGDGEKARKEMREAGALLVRQCERVP